MTYMTFLIEARDLPAFQRRYRNKIARSAPCTVETEKGARVPGYAISVWSEV